MLSLTQPFYQLFTSVYQYIAGVPIPLTHVQSEDDLAPFAERLIAYKTTLIPEHMRRYSIGSDKTIRFGYLDILCQHNRGKSSNAYQINEFLRPNETRFAYPITTACLTTYSLQVRLVTKEEALQMEKDIQANKAQFGWPSIKEEGYRLILNHINKNGT